MIDVYRPRITLRSIVRSGLTGILSTLVVIGTVAATPHAASAAVAPLPVSLGTAVNFTVLAWDSINSVGPTVITGSAGEWPGASFSGFPPGIVTGTTHLTDAVAQQAQTDATAAYNDAAGRSPDATVPAQLGGTTLTPGVYNSATNAFLVTGDLTLDGLGDPDAVFILQAGTLDTSPASTVILTGGAQARNVFWQVGGLVNLGAGSTFTGNVLAVDTIEVFNGAGVNGRLLATVHGAVHLDSNAVVLPAAAPCGTATTTTTLESSCVSGDSGPITFTATVTSSDATVPTGSVTFATDGSTLGTAPLDGSGQASLVVTTLPTGVHRVFATFPGTAQLDPSSGMLIQRVGLGCACSTTSQALKGSDREQRREDQGALATGKKTGTQLTVGAGAGRCGGSRT